MNQCFRLPPLRGNQAREVKMESLSKSIKYITRYLDRSTITATLIFRKVACWFFLTPCATQNNFLQRRAVGRGPHIRVSYKAHIPSSSFDVPPCVLHFRRGYLVLTRALEALVGNKKEICHCHNPAFSAC